LPTQVVKTVSAIVEQLPPELFELVEDESSGPAPEASKARQRAREIIETERKYVQDLEQMQVHIYLPCPCRPSILIRIPQKYATALAQGNIIDQDTIHLLFPNLNKILNFQRKFLILFEQIAEVDWIDQHWGRPFIECVSTITPHCLDAPDPYSLFG
jgi:cell division control protein 24